MGTTSHSPMQRPTLTLPTLRSIRMDSGACPHPPLIRDFLQSPKSPTLDTQTTRALPSQSDTPSLTTFKVRSATPGVMHCNSAQSSTLRFLVREMHRKVQAPTVPQTSIHATIWKQTSSTPSPDCEENSSTQPQVDGRSAANSIATADAHFPSPIAGFNQAWYRV